MVLDDLGPVKFNFDDSSFGMLGWAGECGLLRDMLGDTLATFLINLGSQTSKVEVV